MLCKLCKTREATCHVVEMTVDGTKEVSDLCAECAEASASPELKDILKQTKDAKCEFCGGVPAGTSTDIFALMSAVTRVRHMCLECAREYNAFVLRSLSRVDANLSQAEQMNVLAKVEADADCHLRIWTKQRKAG